MIIEELKKRLNDLSWEEQADFEINQDDLSSDDNMSLEISQKIGQLALMLTPLDLDHLQQDEDYIIWTLRLSPLVDGERAVSRARHYTNHPDGQVRFWVSEIIGTQ